MWQHDGSMPSSMRTVVDHVKGTLLVEGGARIAIGHDDLHGAGTVDDRPDAALILIPVHVAVQSVQSAARDLNLV